MRALPLTMLLVATLALVASAIWFTIALDGLQDAVDELGASVDRWEAAVQ